MLYFSKGSENTEFSSEDLKKGLYTALEKIGNTSKVIAVPPDITRIHSHAGELTRYTYQYYQGKLTDILPAIGTHFPMTKDEMTTMFGDVPQERFRVHKWKEDLSTLGEVPQEYIERVSEGKVHFSWPCQINRLLVEAGFDLILSIGQVVPHEVIGMAGYNKNVLIGTGGRESIHRSHFLGAVYGM